MEGSMAASIAALPTFAAVRRRITGHFEVTPRGLLGGALLLASRDLLLRGRLDPSLSAVVAVGLPCALLVVVAWGGREMASALRRPPQDGGMLDVALASRRLFRVRWPANSRGMDLRIRWIDPVGVAVAVRRVPEGWEELAAPSRASSARPIVREVVVQDRAGLVRLRWRHRSAATTCVLPRSRRFRLDRIPAVGEGVAVCLLDIAACRSTAEVARSLLEAGRFGPDLHVGAGEAIARTMPEALALIAAAADADGATRIADDRCFESARRSGRRSVLLLGDGTAIRRLSGAALRAWEGRIAAWKVVELAGAIHLEKMRWSGDGWTSDSAADAIRIDP
jgi:hypothetical protein